LGWRNVTLYSNPQPGALYLRMESRSHVQSAGIGRSRATLDLGLLTRRLEEITDRRAMLAVRCIGSDVLAATPAPVYRHRTDPDEVLFYRLEPASSASPALIVDFGVSPRAIAAIAVGFVLWLLFPVVALFVARQHILTQERVEPQQRVVLFRRWQRGIYFVPMLTAIGMIVVLRGSFLMYLGSSLAFLIPIAVFVPTLCFSLVARLVGLPLERAAWPERANLPWYRAASRELWIIGWAATVGVTFYVMTVYGGGLRGAAFPMAMMAVPLAFGLGAAVWTAVVNARRKRGTMTSEPDAPDELVAAVRELTASLEKPITRVRVCKPREGLVAGTVVLLGDIAVVGSELTDTLDTEQLASYIAASALAQPRTRADRWIQAGAGWLMGLLAVGLVVWVILGFVRANSRSFLPAILVTQPLFIVCSLLVAKRAQNRQQDADFAVAEGMAEPQRFLQTLRKVEELQLSTSGMDPSARNMPMAQRRQRLERKLGLE